MNWPDLSFFLVPWEIDENFQVKYCTLALDCLNDMLKFLFWGSFRLFADKTTGGMHLV